MRVQQQVNRQREKHKPKENPLRPFLSCSAAANNEHGYQCDQNDFEAPEESKDQSTRRREIELECVILLRERYRHALVDAGPGRGGRGLETISISFIIASRRRRRRRRRLRVRTRAGGV